MIKKNNKYSYEEIKEMFSQAKVETIINPFGKNQEKANKEFDNKMQFLNMMLAIQTIQTLEENLFEKMEVNE